MFHSCLAMAANPAPKGGIYCDTISRLKRHNLGAGFHDSTGHLVPHDHTRLPSTAFTRKSMNIAPADSDGVRPDEQLLGTERRNRNLLNGELPRAVELEDFHSEGLGRRTNPPSTA